MKYSVKNNLLQSETGNVTGIRTSKKTPGMNKKKFIVIHYTAGSSYEGDVETLSTSSTKASCHLVVSRTGMVTQIGNFNDILWHAGKSEWGGYYGLNNYSIGIELSNPGWLEATPDPDIWRSWFGGRFSVKHNGLIFGKHKNFGNKELAWLPFTQTQIETLIDIVEAIKTAYGDDIEVVGHEQIAPGRKEDPAIGIIFPVKLLDKLNGNLYDNSSDFGDFERKEEAVSKLFTVRTSGRNLNGRGGPGSSFGVVAQFKNGSVIEVDAINGEWARVQGNTSGYSGQVWVSMTYLKEGNS